MASWVSLLLFLFCQSISQAQEESSNNPVLEFTSETPINNVVQDPQTGRIYLGAVNTIFQLGPSLRQEARAETGPKEDSRTCTPPASACQDTKLMPNLNKLLLVHPSNGSLIVCGSRYRGICSLLNLSNVEQQLYYSDSKGEKTYVASIEDNVNVVGVMSTYKKDSQNFNVFVVGKGYGSLDSTKLISTRILQDLREWVVFESIIEASTVQTTPFVPKYLHDFRHAFKEDGFVYFLFSRTLDGTDNKNLTFVSRLCEDDHHYYSHTELQLNCGMNNRFNKVQAAYVASPGKELARLMTESGIYGKVVPWSKVLFMVARPDDDDDNNSALCVYPLNSINERLVDIISACYSDSGKISGFPAVDIPYSSKTCVILLVCYLFPLQKDLLENYKCGADFLPSPLASKPRFALKVNPALTKSGLLTSVAVAVENDHTIAFLGNNQGEVFKVHLTTDPYVYSKVPGDTRGEKVNKNLFFDLGHSHLYITTEKKITKVPVQTCLQKKDCQSCVELRDPYCGWCVLEGRCTRRSECRRAEEKNGWLWSPKQQCVKIVSFYPPNLSCKKTDKVQHCFTSHSFPQTLFFCSLFVSLAVNMDFCTGRSLMSLHVLDFVCVRACVCAFVLQPNYVCESIFFSLLFTCSYSCVSRCMSCVASQWGCQWNTRDHTCSDTDDSVVGPNIIKQRQVSHLKGRVMDSDHRGVCLINAAVRHKNQILNVNVLPVYTIQRQENVMFASPLTASYPVTLYNCSMGREDCSLCKNADPKYRCVWCSRQKACVYEKLCNQQGSEDPHSTECPNPEITDIIPRFGPLRGGIAITIRGSNLGIHKEDIKRITVVGETCIHQEEKYSDPIPDAVKPARGPKAGGTLITISGRFLDTGSKDDVQVTIGGVDFTTRITVTLPLQGRGFSRAMTAKEAQAFVGDVQCLVNTLQDDKLFLDPPSTPPRALKVKMCLLHLVFMTAVLLCLWHVFRRKSQQAEREYEKVKHQLENLEESVRDRCKKEFTDLMIEMEDHTNDLSEGRIPFLDYKTYTDRVFFLPSKDGANDVMITGRLDIPEARRATVTQALNQFSNLLNSKTFLINFIRTLERSHDFNARAKVYFASLLTVALHGKLEYYTDIMRTLLLELMEEYVHSKNPKLMLRRSETVVERMLCNWMSICLYQFLKDSAGEPLYKLFRAIKHQIEKGPVDARVKKAKYTLNDTGLLGDDVEYSVLTLQVLVQGEGPDVTPVKVLNCDTISQVKEKIIEQVYRNQPYSQRPKVDSVTLEWRPGSTGQILSDLDLTSQKEGRWKRINTLAHYNVRDNATLVLSRVLHPQHNYDQNQENHEERNALLEDDKVFHLVRPADELDEIKSKRGSIKDKSMTKAITEIYLTRLLSVKGTLQQFVDDFFRSVLCSGAVVPPAVKYFFDFLDEQALKHNNVDEETIHIWKTNSLPLRFWVNILKNPHFTFDVHVSEVVDASLSVIAQTFMDACTKSEHKLSRQLPPLVSSVCVFVCSYYKGIRQMVPVSDQDMNTHLAEVSRVRNTSIIASLDEDPAAQSKQLTLRLQQIAAALENKVTDL
uniref:Sema domain-containing protein n=1 Tax=Amphiprion ocellaris TaxID=80972 RepID=A0A3Q1B8U4_AMPOC